MPDAPYSVQAGVRTRAWPPSSSTEDVAICARPVAGAVGSVQHRRAGPVLQFPQRLVEGRERPASDRMHAST